MDAKSSEQIQLEPNAHQMMILRMVLSDTPSFVNDHDALDEYNELVEMIEDEWERYLGAKKDE